MERKAETMSYEERKKAYDQNSTYVLVMKLIGGKINEAITQDRSGHPDLWEGLSADEESAKKAALFAECSTAATSDFERFPETWKLLGRNEIEQRLANICMVAIANSNMKSMNPEELEKWLNKKRINNERVRAVADECEAAVTRDILEHPECWKDLTDEETGKRIDEIFRRCGAAVNDDADKNQDIWENMSYSEMDARVKMLCSQAVEQGM